MGNEPVEVTDAAAAAIRGGCPDLAGDLIGCGEWAGSWKFWEYCSSRPMFWTNEFYTGAAGEIQEPEHCISSCGYNCGVELNYIPCGGE
jgi:hypothetical protein